MELKALLENFWVSKDGALTQAWYERHPHFLDYHVQGHTSKECNQSLARNVKDFYHDIPCSSPIRAAVVKTLFAGIPTTVTASCLGVTSRSIRYASNRSVKPLSYYLHSMGFPRDRLGSKEDQLLAYICLSCPVPSGRKKRYYFGTPTSMYIHYHLWAGDEAYTPVSYSVFNQIVGRENVGFAKGDLFKSPNSGKLSLLKAERELLQKAGTESTVDKLAALEQEITILQAKEDFAKARKLSYKVAQKLLQENPDEIVLSIDFSNIQTSPAQKFHELVMVLSTAHPCQLPETLKANVLQPDIPPTPQRELVPSVIPQVGIMKRRTKQELGYDTRKSPKLTVAKAAMQKKKTPRLSISSQDPTSTFKPHLTYLYFVTKQYPEKEEKSKIKQTADYVAWAFNLLNEHHFFDTYSACHIWSDGGPKHFKTYPTHFFIAQLQSTNPGCHFTWDFLPPRDAHNAADPAAAHLNKAVNTLIQNYHLLDSEAHVAFAAAKVRNAYMFKACHSEFPEMPEVRVKGEDGNCFMREAFSLSYTAPTTEFVFCNHPCAGRSSCGHGNCCRGEYVSEAGILAYMRSGETKSYRLQIPDDTPSKRDVEEEQYWESSETWQSQNRPSQSTRRSSQKECGVSVTEIWLEDISGDIDSGEVDGESGDYIDGMTLRKGLFLNKKRSRK
jgi:hypothetical protein